MNRLGYCLIGSARHNEYGSYASGKPGDQTGTEVEYQNYYNHSKGWVTLRCIDEARAEMIAQNMEWACANDCVGYSQNDNQSLWREASKINFDISRLVTPVNTDCARLVRVCIAYADIPIDDFYTGNEKQVLLNSGWFKEVKGILPGCLKRGDILVTKTKGHTVVALTNGDGTYPDEDEKHRINPKYGQYDEYKIGEDESKYSYNFSVGRYKITADALNVRQGAGTNYKVVNVLYKNTLVDITNVDGKWGYVKSYQKSGSVIENKKQGWISLLFAEKA